MASFGLASPLRTQMYIHGKFVDAVKGGTFPCINPATEEKICDVSSATAEDIDLAVKSCVQALEGPDWGYASTGKQRAVLLRNLGAIVTSRKAELARVDCLDNGKPMREANADMDDFVAICEYFATLAVEQDEKQDEEIPNGTDDFVSTIKHEPVGVVACITPWNFPVLMAVWKVIPALAAGCAIVLKPSELSPLSCLLLAEMVTEAGFPAGALNVVNGLGPTAGGPLSEHPRVDKISFTGSGPTSQRIMACAASGPRAFTAELGGKSALIAFADCDVNCAVDWAILGFAWNSGQVCSSTSRILVHSSIKDKFVARMCERLAAIQIGDSLAFFDAGVEGATMGPVVSKAQYDKVWGFVEGAVKEGLNLVYPGPDPRAAVKGANGGKGYFVPPVVILDPPVTSKVWTDEIFGPVVCVRGFDSEEEAVLSANDSPYGLAAVVMSADAACCDRVTRRLRVGTVWVNNGQPCFPQCPWGGCKKSGFGKDLGRWGFEEYVHVKQVTAAASGFSWELY